MLHPGDKIGIVCCSNGQPVSNKGKIEELLESLKSIRLEPVCSEFIYQTDSIFSGTGKERAKALMDFYEDKGIKAIFDISGGDIANEVLSYLDFEQIKNYAKPFFGYSDLTTIINAIYSITGEEAYLYQIRNIVSGDGVKQLQEFKNFIFEDKADLLQADFKFIQGTKMHGTVIGGNIRCFLKLAGTPYMPEFKGKILFLESLGGEVAQMTTFFNQLKQMNVFHEINGILLGTFLTMEKEGCVPTIEELVMQTVDNPKLPIAITNQIGHRSDSKCIVIGKEYCIAR